MVYHLLSSLLLEGWDHTYYSYLEGPRKVRRRSTVKERKGEQSPYAKSVAFGWVRKLTIFLVCEVAPRAEPKPLPEVVLKRFTRHLEFEASFKTGEQHKLGLNK